MGQRWQWLVNTYNAIVPHKESNVNVWFGRLTTGGSARQVFAALADPVSVDDTTPKCAWRVQFSHARGGLGWSECQAKVYLSA
jgi:hypothetical protein